MKKWIVAFAVFLALSASGQAGAENLAETAAWACKAFLEHREDFKPIKTEPCEIKAEDGRGEVDAQCFSHEVEGRKRQFAISSGDGSCSTEAVVMINEKDNSQIGWLAARNADVNGYGFGTDDKPLTYKGKFFIANDYDGDLRIATSKDSVILCDFYYQLQGWEEDKNNIDPICKEFAQERYKPQYMQSDDDLKEKDVAQYGDFGPETGVNHIDDIDLEGTGQKVKILTIDYDSGKGCGCSKEWLSLANSSSANQSFSVFSEALAKLTDNTACDSESNHRWSAIEINGKGYVAEDIRNWKKWENDEVMPTTSRIIFPDRVLYKYKNGNFDEICRLHPKMQRMHTEYIPEESLN